MRRTRHRARSSTCLPRWGRSRPLIVARLTTARWSVLKHLLAVIGKLDGWPDAFDARDYMRHPDAGVRREALRLLIKQPANREMAITNALADPDERPCALRLARRCRVARRRRLRC